MTAAICLGSNLGNRKKNLYDAVEILASKGLLITKESAIYETAPVEYYSVNDFLNQVILVETDETAETLLQILLKTEIELGRQRNSGDTIDRTIDLDLLFYQNYVIQTPGLILPHPRLHLRLFVLTPLAEVAKDWIHPQFNLPIDFMLENCLDKNTVLKV